MDKDHVIDWEEAGIVGREANRYKRWIKEAIAIRKQGKTMNRDEGQYNLSHVFDDLLTADKSSGNTASSSRVVNSRSSSLHNKC